MLAAFQPTTISASSNLEIASNADFSAQSREFRGGETIFARIASTSVGSKKSQLNLRDNQYNLINTFKLEREGSYYSAVLPAPYSAGYYSLEAQIESDGASTTSVKTIKVDSPTSANVAVHVNTGQTGGNTSSVLGEKKSESNVQSESSNTSSPSPTSQPASVKSNAILDTGEDGGFFHSIVGIFKIVADFLWPF